MVQINFAQKEIQCKIVYYGPGMSGKTTNLELVHGKVPDDARGELTSIATTGERTLYFDYMPLDLGQIAGIQTKFQLYTVPGQIYYKSTRRLVLQGVDGIVFVADSSESKMRENKESLQDLEDNLKEMGKTLKDVPIIIQYNKRDLPDAMSIEDLQKELNPHGFPITEAVATRGDGVFPTLKQLSQDVLQAVNKGGFANKPKRAPRQATVKAPEPAAVGSVATNEHAPSPLISRPVGGVPDEAYPASTAGAKAPAAPVAASAAAPAAPPSAPPAAAPPTAPPPQAFTPPPTPPPTTSTPHPTAPAGARPHTPTPGEYQTRSFDQRVVKVSGLGGGGGGFGKAAAIVGLGLVIAATAFFILTRVV